MHTTTAIVYFYNYSPVMSKPAVKVTVTVTQRPISCEVRSIKCSGEVHKYGRIRYRCLSEGEHHCFCASHASQSTCPIHMTSQVG